MLSVVLKVVRLAQVPATGPWWTQPADLVPTDLLGGVDRRVVGVGGRWVATPDPCAGPSAAQLSTWAWSVLLVVYHEYWMRTRNTLTLDRLMATWRGRHDLSGSLGIQLTARMLALLAARASGARCCRRCWSS